ncbi:hypothetical protein N0V90_001704 [Kalmusia sp. IMI 367209]|nr:hypothetical protein N0V90_001704 [Kalmusia sp. IMI 367209]
MGLSVTAYATHGNCTKPTGIVKRLSRTLSKPRVHLRSLDQYFWYTDADGVERLAVSLNGVPQQLNDYIFDASLFKQESYPKTFPSGNVWPPQRLEDLVCATDPEYTDCVGDTCYTDETCEDPNCRHTLERWKRATQDWQSHFELRMTEGRGIGVITKRSFQQGAILGWYAGELKKIDDVEAGDYLMDMEIGAMPTRDMPRTSIFVDGETKGNWTRFINHSCDAHAVFRIMRIGNTRIMAVEAAKHIPKGVELSVNYGNEYYGMDTNRRCCCGAANCVEKKRARRDRANARKLKEIGKAYAKKTNVKKRNKDGPLA